MTPELVLPYTHHMSESLEAKAKRLGWSKEFLAGVKAVQESAARDTRTLAQVRADNKRARLAQDVKDQGARQAAKMASKAKRGI